MKLTENILNKSNSYKYYKKSYESLKIAEKDLNEMQSKFDFLTNNYNKIKRDRDRLFEKYEKDYLFFDFEGILSKFYISPIIRSPFSYEDKRCFAFMDHLAKYLKNKVIDNNQPLVSIIFPIFNNESDFLDTYYSILNQTYNNYELIIIDDASEDKTSELLDSINEDNVKIFFNNKRKGFSYCRNLALNNANGEYIFYVDIGNCWCEEYLKSMVGAFLELSDAEAIYSGQLIFDQSWKNISGIIFGSYNKSLLYNTNYISLSAFAHKKSLNNNLRFDESIYSLEDWHFLLNISSDSKMYSIPILQSRTNFESEKDRKSIDLIHKLIDNKKDFSSKYEINKKISIVIPSYELLDDLKECIDVILSFNSDFIDIIVVDNNSNDEVQEYLRTIASEDKIRLIQNKINYGFTYAVELGISMSDNNSDILLLNNDAILTKGALEAMQYYAYNIKDCGIMVPQEVLYGGDARIRAHIPFADSNYECDVTPSRCHKNIINVPLFHDGEILELSFAPFFCTYIKRDIYNKTLGLDAELGRHYRSDRIYSNFVRQVLKLKIYQTSKAKVYHKSQTATKKLKKNKDEFDFMFIKNQWEPELAEKLGYKTPLWDK